MDGRACASYLLVGHGSAGRQVPNLDWNRFSGLVQTVRLRGT
jgi:hypothetical protein